jgi:hypothetical protein
MPSLSGAGCVRVYRLDTLLGGYKRVTFLFRFPSRLFPCITVAACILPRL